MNPTLLLYLACIFAGFSIIEVPLTGLLSSLAPLTLLIGVITILVFSCVIIYQGFMVLFGKKRKL
ncbi:hypothetical protein [Aquibacillus salsiterrae]|uniref:Uncharacterized protein n=1 Tax=Aquibacillus salsiterrae TaxID=2950439 RepID=A0A9X4AF59_9BACI|nr:hypothetical protein [Aquibacillus salsiterrae]MDC3417652.1 hypothetical protein [Aquibacillus salsiterrae]